MSTMNQNERPFPEDISDDELLEVFQKVLRSAPPSIADPIEFTTKCRAVPDAPVSRRWLWIATGAVVTVVILIAAAVTLIVSPSSSPSTTPQTPHVNYQRTLTPLVHYGLWREGSGKYEQIGLVGRTEVKAQVGDEVRLAARTEEGVASFWLVFALRPDGQVRRLSSQEGVPEETAEKIDVTIKVDTTGDWLCFALPFHEKTRREEVVRELLTSDWKERIPKTMEALEYENELVAAVDVRGSEPTLSVRQSREQFREFFKALESKIGSKVSASALPVK